MGAAKEMRRPRAATRGALDRDLHGEVTGGGRREARAVINARGPWAERRSGAGLTNLGGLDKGAPTKARNRGEHKAVGAPSPVQIASERLASFRLGWQADDGGDLSHSRFLGPRKSRKPG
jgi:hypothetical protein